MLQTNRNVPVGIDGGDSHYTQNQTEEGRGEKKKKKHRIKGTKRMMVQVE